MVSDAKLKKTKQLKTQMLWLGVITLPIGVGIFFLMFYSGMKDMIDKEMERRANEA